MKNNIKKKGFTLIELLVVVAIIGILAAVGVTAYSGYTTSAKRNATLAQHKTAIKFIQNSLALCTVNGGNDLAISPTRTIDCNLTNDSSGINELNYILIGHFLDQGWTNPYGVTDSVVYTWTNGSQDTNGRMRFDQTECSSGSNRSQIALWVKTPKDYYPILIAKDGWCD